MINTVIGQHVKYRAAHHKAQENSAKERDNSNARPCECGTSHRELHYWVVVANLGRPWRYAQMALNSSSVYLANCFHGIFSLSECPAGLTPVRMVLIKSASLHKPGSPPG